MPSFCVVNGCEFKYTHSDNISFHRFPCNNANVLKKWIEFVDKGPDWKPSHWSSICSKHFLTSDFREYLSRRRLKSSSIPSIKTKSIKNCIQTINEIIQIAPKAGSQFSSDDLPFQQGQPKLYEFSDRSTELTCRLCSKMFLTEKMLHRILDINLTLNSMMMKCFPSVTIDENDSLPKRICVECEKGLKECTSFINKVLVAQEDIQRKFNKSKPLQIVEAKIKQEPCTVVKEEIFDINKNHETPKILENSFQLDNEDLELNQEEFSLPLIEENHYESKFKTKEETIYNDFELIEYIDLASNCFIDISNNLDEEEDFLLKVEDNYNTTSFAFENEHNYSKVSYFGNGNNLSPCKDEIDILNDNLDYSNIINHVNGEETNKIKVDSIHKLSEQNIIDLSDNPTDFDNECLFQENSVDQSSVKINTIVLACDVCPVSYDSSIINNEHIEASNPVLNCSAKVEDLVANINNNEITSIKNKKIKKLKLKQTCSNCNKDFVSKLALNNHKRFICPIQKGLSFTCKYCDKIFKKLIELNEHIQYQHNDGKEKAKNVNNIIICDKINNSEEKINNNNNNNNNKKISDEENFVIVKLNEMMTTSLVDNTKEKEIIRNVECKDNTKNYEENIIKLGDKKKNLVQLVNGRFVCKICGRNYRRSNNLKLHMSYHRPKEFWNNKCGNCGMLFDKIYDLKKHLKTNKCPKISKANINNIKLIDKKTQKMVYICSICNKQMSSYKSLKIHRVIHTGLKPFVCETCGKCFYGPANLYQHKLSHSEERNYRCNLCSKVFKRSCGLTQHYNAIHLKLKPHICPVCSHSYALKGDMMRCKHSIMKC